MAGATSNGFDKRPQDINRNGRPPKEYCLTDILREQGDIEDVETNEGKIARKQAIAKKLWSMAMSGDVQALKYVYDRIDGRPKESVDMNQKGDITYRILPIGEEDDQD